MSEEWDLSALYADGSPHMQELEIREMIGDLHEQLGHVLFGEITASARGTLATINALRQALDYLDAHYARQIGDAKRALAATAEAAAKPRNARRGRPRKANGTNPEPAGAALPFGPGPGPAAEA
jgi:hypothetical protein